MRRRRNQTHARNRVTQTRDDVVDLVAGKLAAFAGLGALGHLDLEFIGVDEVIRGDAETCGGNLLDRAAARIAVGIGLEALFVFSALAGIGFAANAVHRNGESLVRFFTNRSERHRAGGEAFDDFFSGLYFLEWDRLVALLELHQAAQGAEIRALLVDEVGIFLKSLVALRTHGVLQLADRAGIQQVIFTVHTL